MTNQNDLTITGYTITLTRGRTVTVARTLEGRYMVQGLTPDSPVTEAIQWTEEGLTAAYRLMLRLKQEASDAKPG